MKKIICILLPLFLVVITGCQTSLNRKREYVSNDESYIVLTGKVTEKHVNENNCVFLSIQCDDSTQNSERSYWVFSSLDVNVNIDDTITYTTVPVSSGCFKYSNWLPIVAIQKNGKDILKFEDGKAQLIDWTNQLQYK